MIRFLSFALFTSFGLFLTGCGDSTPTKAGGGGGGSTTAATVKAPPKGERPTME